ncbi:MAG: HAMP domain-containing sensor histidine kinase [Cyanobacteria bacterium P01_H01_bin.21]
MYTSPRSMASYESEIAASDIRQLCQSQIDRLSEKLSALDVWLVRWDQVENKRDMLSSRRHNLTNTEITSYLEPKRWITENLPFLELMPLSLDSSESCAYVCGLRQTETRCEYLLLWTQEHVSKFQRELIKENAQLLHQYLALYQENQRQQEKIQLLEHTIQRLNHQLRNPLALINLYAETIVLDAKNETQKSKAKCIRQTAENISDKLEDLLACGKQASLKKENHNLLALLQNVVQLLKPRIDAKQLTIAQPSQAMSVMVDGWQFEQVLQNLLDNAIYYSPIGSTITIDWHVSPKAVLLTIGDQGPGIGESDPQELFLPFYSQRDGGTGLGLAIAKKIVLDHQGSIGAETLPQGGAQFSIFLPRGQ